MNWVGDYIQNNIDESDTVLDLGCGIMQCTLDFVSTYPKTRLKCKELLGVDIYQPYLDYLDTLGIDTLNWDLLNLPLPFEDNSYDVVLLNDILEHLPNFDDVNRLIEESMRIARKMIFYVTPSIWFANEDSVHNIYPYDQFDGDNEFQRHRLFLDRKYLEGKGFKVIKKGVHFYGYRKLVNKILHVWDVAGVASIMCKYQNRLGYDSKVYINKKFDAYRYSDIYRENTVYHYDPKNRKKILNQVNFISRLKKFVDEFKPDIIHFHGLDYIPIFFKLWGYKMLIEFHGTRIRNKYYDGSINPNRKTPRFMFKIYWALRIPLFVSTPDLLRDIPYYNRPKEMNMVYRLISNPVDTDIFNKSKQDSVEGTALYTLNKYDKDNLEIAMSRAKKRDLELTIQNRIDKKHNIEHLIYSEYLSSFEYFIDRMKIDSLSKTALECLAMGIKVIDWKNKTLKELPYVHDPYNVAKYTVDIYDKILVGNI